MGIRPALRWSIDRAAPRVPPDEGPEIVRVELRRPSHLVRLASERLEDVEINPARWSGGLLVALSSVRLHRAEVGTGRGRVEGGMGAPPGAHGNAPRGHA